MNWELKDGGPAFPDPGTYGCSLPGMTLRDFFAGQALMSALDTREAKDTARRCYELADAMIEARGK